MKEPKFQIGDRVAAYCPGSNDVVPSAKILKAEYRQAGEPCIYWPTKRPELRKWSGWYYLISDGPPKLLWREVYLRPIDDDEYQDEEEKREELEHETPHP